MKRRLIVALALLALGIVVWKWHGRLKSGAKTGAESSPLFTGKEPKLKVKLTFPAKDKSGFVAVNSEIYQTSALGSQVKQVLMQLFDGPKSAQAAAAFPQGFKYREAFITDKGLLVLDLDSESVKALPGGTSSEYVALFCALKSILENFKDLKRVQILVGGESRESLAGHMDISSPLTLEDF